MFKKNLIVTAATGIFFSVSTAHAEVLAGRDFTRSVGKDFTFNTQYEDFAGLTYNALTQTYFMSDNKQNAVLEINSNGNLLRTINVTDLKRIDANVTDADPEGITWMYGTTYAIVMEDGEEMAIVQITPTTTSITRAQAVIYDLSGDPKGVTYNAKENALYWVSQNNPPRVVKATINPVNGELDQISNIDVSALPATDLSDVAYFPRLSTHLLLVSHTAKSIMEVDLNSGSPILRSSFSLSSWPIPEAHGFTFGPDGNMYVVGKHVADTPEDDFSVFTPLPAISNLQPIALIAARNQ